MRAAGPGSGGMWGDGDWDWSLVTILYLIPFGLFFGTLYWGIHSVNAQGEDLSNLSTIVSIDGEIQFIKCPQWDWTLVPEHCRRPAFNCLPICGKYPGDKPDIGAMEWFLGITPEKPWGDWTGVPLTDFPEGAPEAVTNVIIEVVE